MEQTQSTNADLVRLCRAGDGRDGLVYFAKNQIAGYGRNGKQWHFTPGESLAFSIALKSEKDLPTLSLAIGIAIFRAIKERADIDIWLKWPNDILIANKKIAGILIERVLANNTSWYIAGAGLNINNPPFAADLAKTATSLAAATNQTYDINDLFHKILNQIKIYFDKTKTNPPAIIAEYRNLCGLINKEICIIANNMEIIGIAKDISENGGIIIEMPNSTRQEFTSGEISIKGFYQ